MLELHAFYEGQVQGVGFRYHTHQFATSWNISGWVRNLRDGRVELLAQQEKPVLESFIQELERCFSGYITDSKKDWQPLSENQIGFAVIR